MIHTSICQMCHTQIHGSADCILMKVGIMMHFTAAFQHFIPNHHYSNTAECALIKRRTHHFPPLILKGVDRFKKNISAL